MPRGRRVFEMTFDFMNHRLHVATGEGALRHIALAPRSVADFHREVRLTLGELGLHVATRIGPHRAPVDEKDLAEAHELLPRHGAVLVGVCAGA